MEPHFPAVPTGSGEPEQDDRARLAAALRRLHICRGTTGDTIHEALPVIDRRIGVERHEIPHLDADVHPGAAWGTLGQHVIPGSSEREIVLAAPTSEPSTNDHDLSGLAVLTALCEWLGSSQPRFTYRVIFGPAALSVHTSLHLLKADPTRIEGGMALHRLGDSGPLTFQPSRSQSGMLDRIVERTVAQDAESGAVIASEERERGDSPADFAARVGALGRSRDGTLANEPSNQASSGSEVALAQAFAFCKELIASIECGSRAWINRCPYGEPCLGKRGLYNVADPRVGPGAFHMAMLWMLNQSDGHHSLLEIAERSERPLPLLARAADQLEQAGLLEPITPSPVPATESPARATG